LGKRRRIDGCSGQLGDLVNTERQSLGKGGGKTRETEKTVVGNQLEKKGNLRNMTKTGTGGGKLTGNKKRCRGGEKKKRGERGFFWEWVGGQFSVGFQHGLPEELNRGIFDNVWSLGGGKRGIRRPRNLCKAVHSNLGRAPVGRGRGNVWL